MATRAGTGHGDRVPPHTFIFQPETAGELSVALRRNEEFVAVVSHELRTALTSIRGSLGLLGGGVLGELPEEADRMVRVALSNTDRLTRLVNDILDLERLSASEMLMEVASVDAAAVMREVVEQSLGLARSARVALDVDTSPVMVSADVHRLGQALTNLVGNAIKFSEPGDRVSLVVESRGSLARLVVQDHGRGIPPDRLDHIFDRFAQVESTDASSRGGSGLGLPIARRIVAEHDGRLLASSVLGYGSTFTIELPVDAAWEVEHGMAVQR
jgi:signal transduction histidine kinase